MLCAIHVLLQATGGVGTVIIVYIGVACTRGGRLVLTVDLNEKVHLVDKICDAVLCGRLLLFRSVAGEKPSTNI